jgi:hypothetical protein
MRKIPLTRGLFALVDDEDFEKVNRFKWCAQKRKNTFHAARYFGKKYVYMHQFLIPGVAEIDHENTNGLDNQKHNLRPATRSQNNANQTKRKNTSSIFKGVYWQTGARWRAMIQISPGIRFHLGYFDSEIEAAHAYDKAAKIHFGEFARPNFT